MKLDSLGCEQILINDTGQSLNKLTVDLNASVTNEGIASGDEESPILSLLTNTKAQQQLDSTQVNKKCLDSKPKQSGSVKKTICKFKDNFFIYLM